MSRETEREMLEKQVKSVRVGIIEKEWIENEKQIAGKKRRQKKGERQISYRFVITSER